MLATSIPTFLWVARETRALLGYLVTNCPFTSWVLSGVLRAPGFGSWGIAFFLVFVIIRVPNPFADESVGGALDRDPWLEARVRAAITPTLVTIGHGIEIRDAQARPLEPNCGGFYQPATEMIVINSDLLFSETSLLDTVAHECVHALFHQADLLPKAANWEATLLINETAAYVLGAHIAGDVWSRKGGDGNQLTIRLVQEHRNSCDPTLPDSVPRAIWESQSLSGPDLMSPERQWSLQTHFARPKTVDEIDQICRSFGDPMRAAQEIAQRFFEPTGNRHRPTDENGSL